MSHATGGCANYLVSCANCAAKDQRIAELEAALVERARKSSALPTTKAGIASLCEQLAANAECIAEMEHTITGMYTQLAERTQERDALAAALIEAHNAIEQCRDTEDCPDCGDFMAGCELDPKAILSARLAAERKAGAEDAGLLRVLRAANAWVDATVNQITEVDRQLTLAVMAVRDMQLERGEVKP